MTGHGLEKGMESPLQEFQNLTKGYKSYIRLAFKLANEMPASCLLCMLMNYFFEKV